MTFPFSLLIGVLCAPPALGLQRVTTVEGKADLTLLHAAWRPTTAGQARAVFVRAQDEAARQALLGLGIRASIGPWVAARLAPQALQQALDGPAGLQLRTAPAHRLLSVESLQDIHGSFLQNETGVSLVRRGRGVLFGIVDTGLDLHHPAFRRADGTSRVVAIWDQDATTGPAPAAFGYGKECTVEVIGAGNCNIGDPVGHGTHVAGIAAGNRSIGGIASEADIALVRSNDFTQLADAVAYLTQLADARDVPLVVNLSVGGQYGPHDGRTPLEVTLDDMAGPGRIIVAAAGNDGSDRIHIGTNLGPNPVRVALHGLPVGVPTQTLVELWTAPDATVEAAVELWLNGEVQASAPLVASDHEAVHATLNYDGALLTALSFAHETGHDTGLVRHALVFDRSRATYLPEGGTFVLRLRGHGGVQGWISQSDYNAGNSRFGDGDGDGWLAGDGERSIAVPATALKVITVGSYTVRTTWQSQSEGVQTLPDVTLGSLSPFSSTGPTGFPGSTGYKPDLCAPGSVIASARAQSVPDGPDTLDDQLMVMQGTSMASPHVAGVVALMLEANPGLDPRAVRDILRQSARADRYTGATPNHAWGFGKLDAEAAVHAAELRAGGCAAAPPAWNAALTLLGFFLLHRARARCDRRLSQLTASRRPG